MRRPSAKSQESGAGFLWDLLTFERLVTNQAVHLIYWAGLALIALAAFGAIGAAVGVALREASLFGALLAIPVLIGGLLGIGALVLLWRGFCEFYVAIFKISDDLAALRRDVEAERARQKSSSPSA